MPFLSAMNFTAILDDFQSELWHFFIPVPAAIANQFIENTDRRVVCTLKTMGDSGQSVDFQCALMPRGDGSSFINVNKKIRDKLKLKVGQQVEVFLKKDESEYGLPMPDEFREVLDSDPEGNDFFEALTPGKKRSLLYIAGQLKNVDSRISRALAIVEHLKKNEGKINFKQLGEDIKNMNSQFK